MKNLRLSGLMILFCAGVLSVKAQIPLLNSYPSGIPVIYLDFDGQTVSGTSWNVNGPIFCGPSGLNSDQITEVFNRVAEDYRPFTVNITTDSTKYWSAPANKRMRVIITVTSDWYGAAGGVAFINSFTWGDNTPCFVFSALLGYKPKNIGEASSHEAGHTLGLRHQSTYDANCVKISEYNSGQGSGELSWAPIMGVGYSRNLTTWYNGPNSISCSSIQKDLDIITSSVNGISYRSDDYTSSFSTATTESFNNNVFTSNGIIEKNTDQDLFKFTMPAVNLFQLSAVPFSVGSGNSGSNLDLKVTLYNSSQAVLNSYASSSSLSLLVDTTLAPGTYYFKVQGIGNTYAPNYAILGAYSVQGEIVETTPLAVHKLDLKGTFNRDARILNWSIISDEAVTTQTVEISTDGKNFSPLAQPDKADRSYTYNSGNMDPALYRVYVEFENGSHYYSNIVAIKPTNSYSRPKILNNPVNNNLITISSPSQFDYSVFDLNGKMLKKGRLENGMNTITINGIISGMYLIRYSEGGQQWTEKLVKQ